ncbi:MAG TPA: proline dehydrogenase family protein [Anaerolineae bacterium]|nr:proline dehydrogenase family protein [Anaerolineae bacterium]
MMRSFLLWLSRNKTVRGWLTSWGFARRAARRFVAGDTIEDALQAIRELNTLGISATLDHLGENVETADDATRSTEDYLKALEALGASGVQSHVSIKLTALGFDLGDELCRANVVRILTKAKTIGTLVTIDMESTEYTERTLKFFRDLHREFDNVGIVIQSYLYRSEADIAALCKEGAHVRLCKGAYKEPPVHAFPKKADVDASYVRLMKMLLSPGARANKTFGAIATHDAKMIEATCQYAQEQLVPRGEFEFQMLHGIRRDLQKQLAADGYGMRVYVPYGTEWYPYYMRRLAERPANVWFIVSNFFRK